MATTIGTYRRAHSKTRARRGRKRLTGRQGSPRPGGQLGARVKRVGGERFALVCVDPAKRRSEWMMADYFGNVLISPETLEHQPAFFELAVQRVRLAQREHGIEDLIVTVERTGNLHLAPQRAFAKAGFETRVVHPFAVKQFRLPANPGNKTDHTDLAAQHRAAVAGFGLAEPLFDERHRRLQLRARHRRDLVEKASGTACQIREHLHLALPGYAELFSDFFDHRAARAIARLGASPQEMVTLGAAGLTSLLRERQVRFQRPTLDKVLAWARQAAGRTPDTDGPLHHAIAVDLDELYDHLRDRIFAVERDIAADLVRTPYVRLMALPGIAVVSAGEFGGEMGPIANYANANAITGRSGLYPSRYQSDETDHADGPLVRQSNRTLRGALLRIADNLVNCNHYYRGQAECDRARGVDERAIRVKVAKRFSRLAFACVAGDRPLKHSAVAKPDSILEKLRKFHHEHRTPPAAALADLEAVVDQLLPEAKHHEARIVAEVLEQQAKRRRGPSQLGELLPAVLARLRVGGANRVQSDSGGLVAD
jgi:transposase